jgi:hypothetical protein
VPFFLINGRISGNAESYPFGLFVTRYIFQTPLAQNADQLRADTKGSPIALHPRVFQ